MIRKTCMRPKKLKKFENCNEDKLNRLIYTSLAGYNFFVDGWVGNLLTKEAKDDRILVHSHVNHLQPARETPLKPWFVWEKDSDLVLTRDCMAGLSEARSHIGTLLLAAESCYKVCGFHHTLWRCHIYQSVKSTVKSPAKKRQLTLCCDKGKPVKICWSSSKLVQPSEEEKMNFFASLSTANVNSSVLSLVISKYSINWF